MNGDLINQLNILIQDAEANSADAKNWQDLVNLLGEAGYGPRITPAQIVSLVPNVHGINEIIAATQEIIQPAGGKFPRRKLTADDERVITARAASGCPAGQIAQDLGISRKSITEFLGHD